MNSKNVIICEICHEENPCTSKNCNNCGARLNINSLEKNDENLTSSNDTTTNFNNKSKKQKENIVASVIKTLAVLGGVIGVIFGLSLSGSYDSEYLKYTYIISSIVIAIFIYSLGEIIQLLEDIKNK